MQKLQTVNAETLLYEPLEKPSFVVDSLTKRWAAMPAKNCTVCGVEYVPGSGASRYCPACAKKIRREKSNESKRRSREQKRIACMNCPQKMTD